MTNPVRSPSALDRVDFDDGTYAEVYLMTYGKGRLVRYVGYTVLGAWCYDSPRLASAALEVWDGTEAPVGWFRDVLTGVYQPENTRQNLGVN